MTFVQRPAQIVVMHKQFTNSDKTFINCFLYRTFTGVQT